MVPAVLKAVGRPRAFDVLLRVVLLAVWAVLLRRLAWAAWHDQTAAAVSTLFAFPSRVYSSVCGRTLLVLVLTRVRALLVTPTPALGPVVAVVLSTRLVAVVYDPRLRLALSGPLRKRAAVLARPKLRRRQRHVCGRFWPKDTRVPYARGPLSLLF